MSDSPARRRSYVGRHRRPAEPFGFFGLLARMRSRRSVVSVLRLIITLGAGRI